MDGYAILGEMRSKVKVIEPTEYGWTRVHRRVLVEFWLFFVIRSFSEEQTTLYVGSVRTVETLDQRYVLMPAAVKDAYLVHIVHEYVQKNATSSVMIFTNTCKYVLLFRYLHCVISLIVVLTISERVPKPA